MEKIEELLKNALVRAKTKTQPGIAVDIAYALYISSAISANASMETLKRMTDLYEVSRR